MKSPFPGMDPYLEQHWLDVHHALTTYARDQLQRKLPRDLRARLEERVFFESDEGAHYRSIHPDVRIVEQPQFGPLGASAEGNVVTAEPIVVEIDDEPISQGLIEIIDVSSGNRVVTVIEFVSPTNKLPGEGRKLYLQKQREVIAAKASLVEIDFTRAGKRHQKGRMSRIPRLYWATYMVCVARGWKKDRAELYPLTLPSPLPAIRVPLRKSDADVRLELQPLIDQCYENGAYNTIDYRRSAEPPLDAADAAWADELLRSKGLR